MHYQLGLKNEAMKRHFSAIFEMRVLFVELVSIRFEANFKFQITPHSTYHNIPALKIISKMKKQFNNLSMTNKILCHLNT